MKPIAIASFIVLALAASVSLAQEPVGTQFTYQGQLKQDGMPVTGGADFIFSLWDAPVGGNQIGNYVESPSEYPVVDGLFTIELNFNPAEQWIFDGTALWMEVSVSYPSGTGVWELLTPRQRLTAAPFASFATVAIAVPWAGILDMPGGFADGVDDVGDGLFWSLTGNTGTTPGTNYLGTSDDQPLELRVNGHRALRLEPNDGWPNIVAGHSTNYADAGCVSATIAGGKFNSVHGWQSTVGGGVGNEAHANNTTIAGGDYNVIGNVASWASVGGGQQNEATQEYATIPGGQQNFAGGEYSFAAGRRAKVRGPAEVGGGDTNGDEGTFVWADGTGDEFWSTGPNQFLIRADGGVGIGTNDPQAELHVAGTTLAESFVLDSTQLASGSFTHSDTYGGMLTLQYAPAAVAYAMTMSSTEGIKSWAMMSDRFHLMPSDNGDSGAALELMNAGTTTVKLDASSPASGGGLIKLTDADGDANLHLMGAESTSPDGGARILMFNDSNVRTIDLDAQRENGGGAIWVKDGDGNLAITLNGDTGWTTTKVLEITGGSDLSEQFNIRSEELQPLPGMVVCIDPAQPGDLKVSDRAYDRTVAGVISGAGDVKPGMLMGQRNTAADGEYPVALTGRVYCRCDTTNGPIHPGDLLTTSDVPGYAMRAADSDRATGAILGKAMTGLDSGEGLVLVLVSLQ